MRCSHGIRYEDRCNLCVEEGVARANVAAMQTPRPSTPVNVDGSSRLHIGDGVYVSHALAQILVFPIQMKDPYFKFDYEG